MAALPDTLLNSLSDLARQLGSDVRHSQAAAKSFNLFTTLFRFDNEVQLHTRFLRELLDPDSAHGCGAAFLEHFFATLQPLAASASGTDTVPVLSTLQPWSVRRDVACGIHGNVDLLLEQPGLTLLIENKTRRLEQPEQLARYDRFLAERRARHELTLLFFLTPDGWASATAGAARYACLSYRSHIRPWLEACLAEAREQSASPIVESIRQYREVVDLLTRQTPAVKMIDDASDRILTKHPELLAQRELIKEALDAAKRAALTQLVEKFVQALAPWTVRADDSFFNRADGIVVITAHQPSSLEDAPFRILIQNWNEKKLLLLGLDTTEAQANRHKKHFTLLQQRLSSSFKKPVGYATWPVGWMDLMTQFDDAKLAHLIGDTGRDDLRALIEKIHDALEHIEKAWSEVAPEMRREIVAAPSAQD